MHIPQTSAAISGLLVAVWVPARQILHRNIVWGPRAGIIDFQLRRGKYEYWLGAIWESISEYQYRSTLFLELIR